MATSAKGGSVDSRSYSLLAGMTGAGLLGSSRMLDPGVVAGYWSGDVEVPAAIDADVASCLSRSDLDACIRAAVWMARNHVLSGYEQKHHLSLVRWLFEHHCIERHELLSLLALLSPGQQDAAGVEIALIATEMLEEGRLEEGLDLVEPMLLAYTPSL
ncbi:hypothetical protein [Stenotrophomonas sp. 24(2023)]|uniref:hypothetical protein n=1 Tax=Stenotrophomonas sp. 24(2023) TaxID=3068324 RepID=UPI0027DF1B49|nr:hypothetical protein [Stenotrophomonas sp. 24(2023)]WMJ68355.1 hypothetical protein Q9R17_14270 [Stenotrophomonas sp. 24(2023)]